MAAPVVSILRTKIHRPSVDADHIQRPLLLARLNRHRQRPLTLISAPAGYGKSSLASCWLASEDFPGAWVSLDENDNDPRRFVAYVVAAVHSIFPGSLPKTQSFINAPLLPPVSALAQSLVSELDAVNADFVLVLDDYHAIKEKAVHDLLSQLLRHPPAPMHLVLSSRYEPPLPIASFRAHRQMTEIRARDLRFTPSETVTYLNQALGMPVPESTAIELGQKTEGWITGIHLAALSFRRFGNFEQCAPGLNDNGHRNAINRCVSLLPENNRYIVEYFAAEIFSRQPAPMKEMLLRTAILKQFDARLCEALCADSLGDETTAVSGRQFIDWLIRSDLFIIALDDEGRWFRYHHLFQQLLVRSLKRDFSEDTIASLHKTASDWFDRHGLVSDAIDHALAARDVTAAARVLERHRHAALSNDNWPLLENWISRFPKDSLQKQPAMLLSKAWLSNFQGAVRAIPPILEALDQIRRNEGLDPAQAGEIDFFKAVVLFWTGRIGDSLEHLERAFSRVDERHIGAKNEMDVYFATASQMLGRGQAVIRKYQQEVYAAAADGPRKARLIGCLIFIHLLSGDLAEALKWTETLKRTGTIIHNQYIIAWGEYLLGHIYYQRNDLKVAAGHFSRAIEGRFFLDSNSPVDNYAGLALTYQAMQCPQKANETVSQMLAFARQSNSAELMGLADAAGAELMLARGAPVSAARRFGDLDLSTDDSPMLFWVVAPRLTQCRVLLAQPEAGSHRKAAEWLDRHLQVAQATHNIPQTISILALKALACKKLDDPHQAEALLLRALTLARPGGWIRPFVALGPEMRSLFGGLDRHAPAGSEIDTIIAALDAENTGPAGTGPTPEKPAHPAASLSSRLAPPLTGREIEIVDLLKKRLSNREIADTLFISPETVKRHLYNIYKKLSVKNRREASAKIAALNILP